MEFFLFFLILFCFFFFPLNAFFFLNFIWIGFLVPLLIWDKPNIGLSGKTLPLPAPSRGLAEEGRPPGGGGRRGGLGPRTAPEAAGGARRSRPPHLPGKGQRGKEGQREKKREKERRKERNKQREREEEKRQIQPGNFALQFRPVPNSQPLFPQKNLPACPNAHGSPGTLHIPYPPRRPMRGWYRGDTGSLAQPRSWDELGIGRSSTGVYLQLSWCADPFPFPFPALVAESPSRAPQQ